MDYDPSSNHTVTGLKHQTEVNRGHPPYGPTEGWLRGCPAAGAAVYGALAGR